MTILKELGDWDCGGGGGGGGEEDRSGQQQLAAVSVKQEEFEVVAVTRDFPWPLWLHGLQLRELDNWCVESDIACTERDFIVIEVYKMTDHRSQLDMH